jgi:lecithin:retinol acyltransferase
MPKNAGFSMTLVGAIHNHRGGHGGALLDSGDNRDEHIRCRKSSQSCELLETIQASVPEPNLGAHVVTPRRGYFHHGIYVGEDKVVHYAGFRNGLRRGSVEEVPFDHFTRGRPAWVILRKAKFDCQEVIDRARSRLGEDSYRLWTNNCEHFCEWCLRGEHRSFQVERWMQLVKRLSARISVCVTARRHPV